MCVASSIRCHSSPDVARVLADEQGRELLVDERPDGGEEPAEKPASPIPSRPSSVETRTTMPPLTPTVIAPQRRRSCSAVASGRASMLVIFMPTQEYFGPARAQAM